MPRPRPELLSIAPPSLLWSSRADGVLIECFARLYVGGIYVEVRLDGAPMIGRTFVTGDLATRFSDEQRQVWDDRASASARLR